MEKIHKNLKSKRILKPKALLFIGFRHKKSEVLTAREEGYKTILLTKQIENVPQNLFDEVFDVDVLNVEFMDGVVRDLRKRFQIKGIISNYEHYVVPRSYLAERFRIPSASVYSACCTRNKAMQRHALSVMKENIDFRVVKNLREAKKAFKDLGEDVFLKSISGIKSRLIFHLESQTELEDAFQQLKKVSQELDPDLYDDFEYCDFDFDYPNPRKVFLIEKAEYGRQITVSGLAGSFTNWNAQSVVDIYPAAHLGRRDGFLAFRILPSNLDPKKIKEIKKVVDAAARILGLRYCPIFAELILKENGEIKLIEIASRMGGYRSLMYQKAYNFNFNKLLVKSVIGKEVKMRKKAMNFVSMMEIFPQKEGIFKGFKFIGNDSSEISELAKDSQISEIQYPVEIGQKIGLAKNNFPPVLKFLISGNSYEEVYAKSIDLQEKIEVTVR